MYKAGKNWLFAGISIATFGSVLLFGTGNVKAATTASTDSADEATETATSTASELTAQSVALKTSTAATKTSSAATTATSAASSTTTTSSASTKASSATPASTATATSSAANSSASTKVASSATATSTVNSSAAATSTAAASSANTAVSSSASSTATTDNTVSSANTVSTTSAATSSASNSVASKAATSSLSSQSATKGDSVATASSAATTQTSATVLTQLPKGTTVTTSVNGATQFNLPVGADTSAAQRIVTAANLSTPVTVTAADAAADTIDTGTLDGTNPAGADAATSNLAAADIPDSFDVVGSAKTTDTPGTVTLTNGAGQNGSYVFDNQVDTSKTFTLTGSYLSTAYQGTGGGLGIIIQPVDPQDAGKNSNTTADVGIDGLANTTFVGRDFYVDSTKNDTTWNHLTIRQTDANGNMVLTPLANITSGANQTAAVTKGEYYVLTWTPTRVDSTTGAVTGTLNYTSYLDAAHTTSVQTTGNVTTTLSRAVSLAAFGATGGTGGTQTATVTAFTGTRVTMPVKVHYVDQTGKTISDDNTITVNVGSTFGVGAETDTANNTATSGTYAAKAVAGYTFGAATDAVTVVNTNITTDASNEITVTYLANAGTQNVSYDQTGLPDGTTGDFSTQTQTATEASTTAATADAAKGYSAVTVTQVPGYTSMVSVNGADPVAMTTIPAVAAGAKDETDAVTYVANTAAITVNYVDYFGNTIKTGTTTFTGNYGDVDNLTTNAATALAIDGYTLGATDAVNTAAAKVSFTLDADGNVVATDASGNPVTSITLTYETNVTAAVSGTKVYDGLDGQDNGATSEQDDYKNLTFVLTDSKGNVLNSNIDASGVTNRTIYYESADAGNYPDAIIID